VQCAERDGALIERDDVAGGVRRGLLWQTGSDTRKDIQPFLGNPMTVELFDLRHERGSVRVWHVVEHRCVWKTTSVANEGA
jgi:hypothetical protein